jgi:hypothetical protein
VFATSQPRSSTARLGVSAARSCAVIGCVETGCWASEVIGSSNSVIRAAEASGDFIIPYVSSEQF